MASAHVIANWIAKFRADGGVPIDPMSLQKHLFYAQAFCLALHGEPLFIDDFEAWNRGPVVPRVWSRLKANRSGLIEPDEKVPAPQISAGIEEGLVDIVQFFGRLTPWQLSDATHNEQPWVEARGSRRWYELSQERISKDKIRKYYAELLSDGEDAFSRAEQLDLVPEPRSGHFYKAGICVRMMKRHPLYDIDLTERLTRPTQSSPPPSPDLFRPPTRRDYFSASDL